MDTFVVDVNTLSFQVQKKQILKQVSMQVAEGEIYALVGNNGAGKTTLLKILLGMELRYQGNIRLFGSDNLLSGRQRIGTVMSILNGNPSLKGREYLKERCILCGVNPAEEIPRVADMVECSSYLNKRLSTCSDGMYQRILIAGALVGMPSLLILDEPFNAIDPYGMEKLRILLNTLNQKGVTILVTSHILSELTKLATKFGVICEGSMRSTGSLEELKNCGYSRFVYHVDSLAEGIRTLEQQYPALCCIPCRKDTIAVIAKQRPVLPDAFRYCDEETADIEEILRFYMSGKEMAE